jgi:hypothetical protein
LRIGVPDGEAEGSRVNPYNTAAGIRSYLADLAGLNRLFADRHAAGYERKERMAEFCVLGRFYLDTCGNCAPITENAPADLFKVSKYSDARCPDVMTRDELELFMRGESLSWSMQCPAPPVYARCSVCGEAWTIENCHDVIHNTEHGEATLDEFVGQPLGNVRQIAALVGKRSHYINRDRIINVTRAGKPDGLMRDGRPWFRVKDSHVIQAGDVVTLQIGVYTHDACYRRDSAARQRTEFEALFENAGFPRVNLVTIPNEYHGGGNGRPVPYYAAPWYLAQVGNGPVFKIGWRKSVINIDWSASGLRLGSLFASEDVTKDSGHIHAHGYEKAAEYLGKLVPALAKGVSDGE